MASTSTIIGTSIEISGEPEQYPPSECLPLLKQYGIRCWGAVTLTLGDRNLAAKDPAQRAATVDYMKSLVEMVHQLEGTEVTVVPATVGKVIPDATPEEEWGWVVAGSMTALGLVAALGAWTPRATLRLVAALAVVAGIAIGLTAALT